MFCRWPVFEPLHWEIPWIRLSLGLKPEGQLETISLWQIWSTCISISENTTSIARRKMPKPLRVTVPISHYQKYTKPERRITSGAWRRIMRLRCYTHAPASAVHLVLAKSGSAMYLERLPRHRPDTESNTQFAKTKAAVTKSHTNAPTLIYRTESEGIALSVQVPACILSKLQTRKRKFCAEGIGELVHNRNTRSWTMRFSIVQRSCYNQLADTQHEWLQMFRFRSLYSGHSY